MRLFPPIGRCCLACSLLLILVGCAGNVPVNKDAETYFREGDEFYKSHQYEDAIAQWRRVKESYASPELTTMAELKIADAQFDNGNYIEAAASYEEFRKLHPTHPQADYAYYRRGLCYYRQIDGIDTDQTPVKNAVTVFEGFLKAYPQSPYAADVRTKLAECRNKEIEYEVYVGRFYYRTDKYGAAIGRLEGVLAAYPKSPLMDEALYYLGASYMENGERAKGREAYNRLYREFPNSRYVNKARSEMDKYY